MNKPFEMEKGALKMPTIDPGVRIGHVHLKVADLQRALDFYCGVLGFELTTSRPGAAFISAGGYHHHLGLNTWAGVGAPPPPPDVAGLRHFTVVLPNLAALEQVAERVRHAGIALEQTDGGLLVRDPSHNGVVLASRPG